ncbi:MAG: M48 family metallopeptidase [Planctomycetes bacterium]|nr:M48 family metallopeptidase [Planctomycetota bacterium]
MAQFEQLIAANKRNSVLLVVVFVLFICGLGGLLGWAIWGDWRAAVPSIAIALVVALVTGLIGYYSGPQAVLALSRARPISKQDDPQLYNVAEELTLASGLPMPKLYIIDTPAMNAFATGRDPEHAHIAVTSGLRDRLGRDQLQGVLAHELSHVKNFDIRFMTLMAVLVGTVVMLAHIGTRAMWFGGGRRRGSGKGGGLVMLVVLIVALVLAVVAPILARLIQLAVSRQREFLADASAAHMTRYPEGLASALEALAADVHEMPQANGANAHLFIHEPRMARGERKRHGSVWSSHPPIEERIARIRAIGNIGA